MHITILCDRDFLAIPSLSLLCCIRNLVWVFFGCPQTYRQLLSPVKIAFMQFVSVCLYTFRRGDAQSTLPPLDCCLRLWGVGFLQTLWSPSLPCSIPKVLANKMPIVWAMYRAIAYTSPSTIASSRCIILGSPSEKTSHWTLLL